MSLLIIFTITEGGIYQIWVMSMNMTGKLYSTNEIPLEFKAIVP